MITTIDIRISAGHVNLPIPLSAVIAGSAATVNVGGVPGRKQGVAIDGVAVVVTNPAGVQQSFAATAQGGQWVATVPATMFASAGSARNGVVVEASGKDETGATRTWRLGMGDLVVIAADASTANLGELVLVKHRATQPATPTRGDLCKIGGTWKLYNGTAWEAFGGGGVTDYNDLDNKPQIGGVTLAGDKTLEDIGAAAVGAVAVKPWTAGMEYAMDAFVVQDGVLYSCTTAHTAGSSFDAAEKSYWGEWQKKLAAGPGIAISGAVVSCTVDPNYAQGGSAVPHTGTTSIIPGGGPAENRVVYGVVPTGDFGLYLPQTSGADAGVANFDLVVDARNLSSDPQMDLWYSSSGTIVYVGGAAPKIEHGGLTMVDFVYCAVLDMWLVTASPAFKPLA